MIAPARSAAFRVLNLVGTGRAFSSDALQSPRVTQLDPRDRDLTTEIVYGSLRAQALLDHFLAAGIRRDWAEVDPSIQTILRLSLYQLWRLDRVPGYAVVHDAVELAKTIKRPWAGPFVNGVLRGLLRKRPWNEPGCLDTLPPWVRLSLPRWLWERWKARFGDGEAARYACSLNRPPLRWVRAVPGRLPPQSASGSEFLPGAFSIADEREGKDWPIQDEASQLAAHLLPLAPGGRAWDVCAAPGGKTEILRLRCGPAGRILASDISSKRASRLKLSLSKGAEAAETFVLVADGRRAGWRCTFDAILVDAPCSGLGTLRRNPEIRWRFRPEMLPALCGMQASLLEETSSYLSLGGFLLYSTCSTEPEENEQVVRAFLERHPDFSLERPPAPPGCEAWIGQDGCFRTFPSERLWDGFFAALMRRNH